MGVVSDVLRLQQESRMVTKVLPDYRMDLQKIN